MTSKEKTVGTYSSCKAKVFARYSTPSGVQLVMISERLQVAPVKSDDARVLFHPENEHEFMYYASTTKDAQLQRKQTWELNFKCFCGALMTFGGCKWIHRCSYLCGVLIRFEKQLTEEYHE